MENILERPKKILGPKWRKTHCPNYLALEWKDLELLACKLVHQLLFFRTKEETMKVA